MTRKQKRVLLALGAVAVAALVALNIVAYNQAYTMTHFARGGTRTPKAEKLSGAQRLKTLLVRIRYPPAYGAQPFSADESARFSQRGVAGFLGRLADRLQRLRA